MKKLVIFIRGNFTIALIEADKVQNARQVLANSRATGDWCSFADCSGKEFTISGGAIDGWYFSDPGPDRGKEMMDLLKKAIEPGEEWKGS